MKYPLGDRNHLRFSTVRQHRQLSVIGLAPLLAFQNLVGEVRPFVGEASNLWILSPVQQGLLIFLAISLFAFLVFRRFRSHAAAKKAQEDLAMGRTKEQESEPIKASPEPAAPAKPAGSDLMNGSAKARWPVTHPTLATPDSLYGAYRIDQEVGKLILGQPYRMDVLLSRAPGDRRAIETSLVKVIGSSVDEDQRRLAREALEEYGLVARKCTAMLLAPDAYERSCAARSLGEIKSPAALPFLLEALYDHESIVRNQAVISIGELKLPKAIGALLEMSRKHPGVPSSLVSRALSACSVETMDFLAAIPKSALPRLGHDGLLDEINHLEPSSSVEDLPGSDDEVLAGILAQIHDADSTQRVEAALKLAQYQVCSSVVALSSRARRDPEPKVRAQAISSLATINHESVFPAVLIGMADESREVRAAAARSLNRLSFDRADAYVRLIETADDELLQDVARACIKAEIVSQGIDRLAKDHRQPDSDRCRPQGDRRQAYETFAIVSLLAKAKLTESIVEAISDHPNVDVRQAAVRLLSRTKEPEILEQFRKLAFKDGINEEVRTALLKAMYELDQAPLKDEELQAVPEVEEEAGLDADGAFAPKNDFETEICGELKAHADELEN